jgi:hypothetical protein
MASKLLYNFFKTLTVILIAGSLISCTALAPTPEPIATPSPAPEPSPTPAPSVTPTLAACEPSEIQASEIGFSEIQGTMRSDGEVWALLFFDKARTDQELKIVWKITATDEEFTVQARHEDGTVISPVWGPEAHEGSNWNRPGDEWGTGFNFPEPGCWTLTATRGDITGEISLEVSPS